MKKKMKKEVLVEIEFNVDSNKERRIYLFKKNLDECQIINFFKKY